MSEELNQLSLWIEVLEYNFRAHTLRGRFPNSKVEINFKLNQVVESQLLKIIDSGKTPKRIKVFIEGSDILSLDSYDQLSLGKKDEESLQELRDIVKGKYSVAQVEKMRDQLEEEIRVEVQASEGIGLYSDSTLKERLEDIYFGLVEGGDSKDLTIYLRNSTSAVLNNIQITLNDEQVEVVKVPTRIFPNQGGQLVLRYTPDEKKKKPLHVLMNITADEIYADPKHYKEIFK